MTYQCAFCPQPGTALCEWPVEKFRLIRYDMLRPGDKVHRLEDRTGRPPAIVESVERVSTWTLDIKLGIRGKVKTIWVERDSMVQVLRVEPCLIPCCEAHLRCVEPGCEYCCGCWSKWEAVA